MATLGDKVKSWIPLGTIAFGLLSASILGFHNIGVLASEMVTKVDKPIYRLQLAEVTKSHSELKNEVSGIKATQQQQTAIKVRQDYMKEQIESSNKKIESLDKKMDDKFDDLKDFIRGNIKR